MTRPRVYSTRKRRPSISIRADVYERLKRATDTPSATVERIVTEYLDNQTKGN
jgi:hypothetical protein